jgi:hypothetical protein
LRIECIGDAGDDLVLHVEKIGHRFFEPLGPKVIAALGINELHVDAHPHAAALNASLDHIPDVQLAPNLRDVEGFAFIRERGVASDYERAADARQIRRQALGHAIDEILLFRVSSHIGERQNHDREARGGFVGRWDRSGLAHVKRIDANRLGDVLELRRAEVGHDQIEPTLDLSVGVLGQTDRAGLRNALQPCGDIDAVAHEIAVALRCEIRSGCRRRCA